MTVGATMDDPQKLLSTARRHCQAIQTIIDQLTEIAFHIGARVAAKARAGEVLVSSAVKDLMSQSGVRFKDRGVHQLKGVPERWRLYRVDHEASPAKVETGFAKTTRSNKR